MLIFGAGGGGAADWAAARGTGNQARKTRIREQSREGAFMATPPTKAVAGGIGGAPGGLRGAVDVCQQIPNRNAARQVHRCCLIHNRHQPISVGSMSARTWFRRSAGVENHGAGLEPWFRSENGKVPVPGKSAAWSVVRVDFDQDRTGCGRSVWKRRRGWRCHEGRLIAAGRMEGQGEGR